jgi:type II secretory pathway predicted ATPase ExeA
MIDQFFGFTSTPFSKEIPTDKLYQSASFRECMARLHYMVRTRSFGLLSGEIGAGKSTAVRALKDALDMTRYRFIYLCDSSLKPRDFYREVLFQLGIVPQNLKNDAKRQYERAISDLYESQGKIVIVALDEL